ncbi:YvrJ family protein [Candidatus Clostridium helianthi]|uniref:YvrJ family protein n=1 Tax=Candidatus Clostridium helianthi TaxID=3381660 RepID=A0ABW8S9B0_9CLOT
MQVTDLINLMVNNSFAIAVAAYLLIRLERQIDNLSSSINRLNTIISAKLGVAIDTDSPNDDSHNVA